MAAPNEVHATNGIHPPKQQLLLNAFVINAPGHLSPGLWKCPGNRTTEYKSIKFWTDLAKLLDNANFHALFIADVLGPYDGTMKIFNEQFSHQTESVSVQGTSKRWA